MEFCPTKILLDSYVAKVKLINPVCPIAFNRIIGEITVQ